MIDRIWAALPADGVMQPESMYGWTTDEHIQEWRDEGDGLIYAQFIRLPELPVRMSYPHPGYRKLYPISLVLRDMAAQEGCDGEPYDAMVFAACVIDQLAAIETARQRNARETWEAMCAMRNVINEHIPMPSTESDLLEGPEASVFLATVTEAVIKALTARLDEAVAAERVRLCNLVCPDLQFMVDSIAEDKAYVAEKEYYD